MGRPRGGSEELVKNQENSAFESLQMSEQSPEPSQCSSRLSFGDGFRFRSNGERVDEFIDDEPECILKDDPDYEEMRYNGDHQERCTAVELY